MQPFFCSLVVSFDVRRTASVRVVVGKHLLRRSSGATNDELSDDE
jgi:hypothetical protein